MSLIDAFRFHRLKLYETERGQARVLTAPPPAGKCETCGHFTGEAFIWARLSISGPDAKFCVSIRYPFKVKSNGEHVMDERSSVARAQLPSDEFIAQKSAGVVMTGSWRFEPESWVGSGEWCFTCSVLSGVRWISD